MTRCNQHDWPWEIWIFVLRKCWDSGIVWGPIQNELTRNLSGNIQPQSSQLTEPLWTDPGIKSGISVYELISALKKKKKHMQGMNGRIFSQMSQNSHKQGKSYHHHLGMTFVVDWALYKWHPCSFHFQVHGGDFPHLLVYGPSGAGKKTRVMCILRELYGSGVEKLRIEHNNFTTPSNKKLEIVSISSNYHIEVNPR